MLRMKAKRFDNTACLKSGQDKTQRLTHGLADPGHILLWSSSRLVVLLMHFGGILLTVATTSNGTIMGRYACTPWLRANLSAFSYSGRAVGLGPHRGRPRMCF